MEIDNSLQRNGENVAVWLKRLDKGKNLLEREKQAIAPEIYEKPVKLPKGQKVGVDINQLIARTLEDNGDAIKVLGELVDSREPKVAGRRLSTMVGPARDMTRLRVVVEAVLSEMGPTSQAIVREVYPRDKKWRRQYPEATKPFSKLCFGAGSTVVNRVVARLEPDVKEKLVKHSIGETIYILQAPIRGRIREMVREENDPFFTG